jgi:hypothetical protein
MSVYPLEDSSMSLKPQEDFRVPDETRRVALAAFPKGCACFDETLLISHTYHRYHNHRNQQHLSPSP